MRKRGQLKASEQLGNTGFQEKLIEAFRLKKERNKRLSLRDFSRMVDSPVSTVSLLMRGTTTPTKATIEKIGLKLGWSDEEIALLNREMIRLRARSQVRQSAAKSGEVDSTVAGSLLNLAILTLATVPLYPADSSFIAKHLDVSETDVANAMHLLLKNDLISIQGNSMKCSEPPSMFVSDPPEAALLKYKKLFS